MAGAFAKLFGEGDDQILFVRVRSDTGEPSIKVSYRVPDSPDFELVINTFSWEDTDEGWAEADKKFEGLDAEEATKHLAGFRAALRILLEDAEKGE